MDSDEILPDAGPIVEEDLDDKYPNRPHNRAPTLPFHELYSTLFNPLSEIKKRPAFTGVAKRRIGPKNQSKATLNPYELRRDVITRFVSRWRHEVGDDIYPAFRLILPERDRDRPMYGMKEKVIGKMLVKIMKINKESEDGYNLLNWKLPGQSGATRLAGDFAGRCYDVLSKRPIRTEPGDMSIEEVNEKLDKLSAASKEGEQVDILTEFYRRMNPDELTWLIRIILRQMKIGASERTFLNVWHPDAESLYSISSSLRRVCWELHDPNIRLEGDDRGIGLMQCFQPQLAQFQMHSLEKMVSRMRPTEEDPVFWIEEKMDGERMQLHMASDESVQGGRKFGFWSRKAKDYTYLYGNGISDENGALTIHLKDAFADGVQSLILDGEMITWDPEEDAMVPFGTLKTAALAAQRNPLYKGPRPLFRVFDILHLNGRDLSKYTLRDRRNALQKVIRPVDRRFEILPYEEATTAAEVEKCLRRVVAQASEGLVLKNPRAQYRLNQRHDDWMKVKPEYMTDFGEALDLVIIGGYYGQGHRGGILGSFLCGLRVDNRHSSQDGQPEQFWSFCKVGGGFTAADYREIRHHTDDKFQKWDSRKPPTQFIELAGGDAQYERPDEWIKPSESLVVCVKASSVAASDEFRMGLTLRFPRFKKFRKDKNWKTALSVQEFLDLKSNVEKEQREKEFEVDNSRRKRARKSEKKPLTIAGYNEKDKVTYAGPSGHIFDQLNFYASAPEKRSKGQLEQLVKANGGKIFQTNTAAVDMICIAERSIVNVIRHVEPLLTRSIRNRQSCLTTKARRCQHSQTFLGARLHMFFVMEDRNDEIEINVDQFSDSYARDTNVDELKEILENMANDSKNTTVPIYSPALHKIEGHIQDKIDSGYTAPCGWLFRRLKFFFCEGGNPYSTEQSESPADIRLQLARNTILFGGANTTISFLDLGMTHIVVNPDNMSSQEINSLRRSLAERPGKKLPDLVSVSWVEESWENGTLLDEERK
ncbi:Nucleic acid-binding OB-fold [Penicillium angulare]|uniref:Nucleic acid-binding OB-fold n=1 Tax=Penicillium angulare TaxID=116970 RepID=UPI00253F83CF|nr:Nucleic acid-binding OB-fold [Penicillium angulare]KAJ5279436.1 Nucleic acid-binding OB-fold [Penicillium angulare]